MPFLALTWDLEHVPRGTFVEHIMHSHSKRLMISTAALILFLATAVYLQWQWLALIVPAAILVWLGLVMPAPPSEVTSAKKLAK